MLRERIHKQTSRHIGKVLSLLETTYIPKSLSNQIRRELWFLHDDIIELIFQNNWIVPKKYPDEECLSWDDFITIQQIESGN